MYIVLEGIVGSGKSTQVRRLVDFLGTRFPDREILSVREPGSTGIAEDIRHLAQKKEWENEEMSPITNAYLYAAARAQLLHTVIKPSLIRGAIVVSDRSFLSSLAQQWWAQWLGIETVLDINQVAIGDIIPDLVIYLDVNPEQALNRIFDSNGDKWEKMGLDFFSRIISWYEECEKLEIMKNRFSRIDANGNEDEVFEWIKESVASKF